MTSDTLTWKQTIRLEIAPPVPYGKEMELTTHSFSRIRPNHSLINTFTVGN
jgi:hypothetical protein